MKTKSIIEDFVNNLKAQPSKERKFSKPIKFQEEEEDIGYNSKNIDDKMLANFMRNLLMGKDIEPEREENEEDMLSNFLSSLGSTGKKPGTQITIIKSVGKVRPEVTEEVETKGLKLPRKILSLKGRI